MDQFLINLDGKAAEHRCVPFWSLNDRLEPDVLREQIRQMKSAGIGGFFMHARGGLETEYMSEDWLNCISACIDEAGKQNMDAWAYDENGWPSGFADGVVTAKGFDYWQKWLAVAVVTEDVTKAVPLMPPPPPGMPERPAPDPITPEHVLGWYRISDKNAYVRLDRPEKGAYVVYIGYNRYYIDILSKKVIACFLEVTHEKYFARCGESAGKSWRGFFTDEPQYAGRQGLPWSTDFASEFIRRFGYDIVSHIPALLMPFGGCERIRSDYWTLVSEMFTEAFGRQIHDWCRAHNLEFTGHMMAEDDLTCQIDCTSGVMQFYPYFDMPGMDYLGRRIDDSPLQPKQVGSVAEQLGRRALTETFALCGWDVSWEELKWIAEWQYVNGINVTCQHLAPYSLRGLRKRDYPPALSIQESWFPVYKHFNDYFSRLGAALSEGRNAVRVLMLHPIHSAYVLNQLDRTALSDLDKSFIRATNLLSDNHVDFHYGDESVMKQYASVEGSELVVGRCRYQAFVLPKSVNITAPTFELLRRFVENGGRLYALDDTVPTMLDGRHDDRLDALMAKAVHLRGAEDVIRELGCSFLDISEGGSQCGSVHYMKRILDDGSALFFLVNHDNENSHEVFVDFGEGSLIRADLADMTEEPVQTVAGRAKLHFSPMQSCFFILRPAPRVERLSLGDSFTVKAATLNAMTLDFCDYRIDGGEWVENTAIILLQRRLLELRRPCEIELRLKFNIEADNISEMYACIETPTLFTLDLNGHALNGAEDCGCYIDQAFRKINILPYIRKGENVLTMSRQFTQKQHVYDMLFGENIHETELNKLTYDSELESVYLLGDFDVYSLSGYTYGERKATFTDGPFVIRDRKTALVRGDFGEQGYRFFSGILTVAQKLTVSKQPNTRYVLAFDKPWVPVFKLFCNGREVRLFGWADYEVDLTDFLTDGENELAFELYASNRNLLGPHHYALGECYFVGPSTFTDIPGWADPPGVDIWSSSYCFVRFGVR